MVLLKSLEFLRKGETDGGNGGITSSYIFVAVVAIIGAIAVAALGRETKGDFADDVAPVAIIKRNA